MLRTYDFYQKKFSMSKPKVDFYKRVIEDFENGIINEGGLRNIGINGLIFCLGEAKLETLIKLLNPVKIVKDGKEEYKYLIDAMSLGFLDFIDGLPTSIMKNHTMLVKYEQEDEKLYGANLDKKPVTLEDAANDIILTEMDKKRIIDVVLNVDMNIITKIKIKDVLARQIGAMAKPIRSIQDVAKYCEVSNYFPAVVLFSKNIATTSNDTVGCYNDSDHTNCKCEISINFDSLDEYNQCIAEAIVGNGLGYFFPSFNGVGLDLMISVPCNADETVAEVNARMLSIVAKFNKQDILHAVTSRELILYTMERWIFLVPEEYRSMILTKIHEEDITDGDIVELLSYFDKLDLPYVYDEDCETFYSDEYCLRRHREYMWETGRLVPDCKMF